MSANLQSEAAALIVARQTMIDFQGKYHQALAAFHAAEVALIDAYMNDDSEDVGSAIVCNGYALVLADEYWHKAFGDKVQIHRAMGAPS